MVFIYKLTSLALELRVDPGRESGPRASECEQEQQQQERHLGHTPQHRAEGLEDCTRGQQCV